MSLPGFEGLKGKALRRTLLTMEFRRQTIYDSLAKVSLVKKGIRGMAIECKNVNTVQRETEEDINTQIEAAKTGK